MRRWLAFIAGLGVIVVSGVAFGLSGSESPSTTVEAEKVVVADHPGLPVLEGAHEERWAPDKVSDSEEPKGSEEQAEPPEEGEELEVDTTPPAFQILHPTDGQVFESKKVVFEGTSEPGAAVFAGEYEADVDDAGNWRI
ncbi:MAG: hypothetical protein WEE53_10875, partial [Acidimicrobiia bacterium]